MNPLTKLKQRLNRLGDDERAVSPVIGFVLIFALIMIVFTLYQTNVVPAQNSKVEFKHSQTVETQMSQLNDAIKATSADGVPHSQTIATGMQYPSRALFINPGPPTGALHTVDEPDLQLDGINVAGSAYWNGNMGGEAFENLRSLEYTIDYNEQQNNPTLSLDDGILTKGYGNGNTLTVGDQSNTLISGRQINLYLMGGDYQQSAASASPTAKPISTSTHYLHFKSDGHSEIPIDSGLSSAECTDKWKRILGPGFSSKKNSLAFVKCRGGNSNVMKLKPNKQFSIRITKIGFGDVTQSTPWEVVPTETSSVTISSADPTKPVAELDAEIDKQKTFTVQVRDKYGNPVPNTDLKASGDSAVIDNLEKDELSTNDDGTATLKYTPGSGGDKTIDITIDGVSTHYDTARYKFSVPDPESSSGSDDDNGGFSPGPPKFDSNDLSTSANYQGQFSFDIVPSSSIEIEGFAIETKYDLNDVTKTNEVSTTNNHKFKIMGHTVYDGSGTPIQFDGRKYPISSYSISANDEAHIEIYKYNQSDHGGKRLKLDKFVDSPRESDLEVIFFLSDGSQRAVYIDGHLE